MRRRRRHGGYFAARIRDRRVTGGRKIGEQLTGIDHPKPAQFAGFFEHQLVAQLNVAVETVEYDKSAEEFDEAARKETQRLLPDRSRLSRRRQPHAGDCVGTRDRHGRRESKFLVSHPVDRGHIVEAFHFAGSSLALIGEVLGQDHLIGLEVHALRVKQEYTSRRRHERSRLERRAAGARQGPLVGERVRAGVRVHFENLR